MGRITDYASISVCDTCGVYYVTADGHDCKEENNV